MAQAQVGTQQNLEQAVISAAKAAFTKANVRVAPGDQIMSDFRDFANRRNKPNASIEQDLPSASQAAKFVSTFVAELKKAGVYEQYAGTMEVSASGNSIVLTQKAPGEKTSAGAGQAVASGSLGDAINAAAQKVGVTLSQTAVEDFILAYQEYLKDKKNGDLNGGSTLPLVIGPQAKAKAFAEAFLASLKESDVTAKVAVDSPNKYKVVLEIPALTATAMADEEIAAVKPKKAR
jgi:plastocyanin